MPLRSKHFRDNHRLQQCLVSDQAHVTLGQTGEHVSLVQYALMRLLVADLAESETDAMRYGTETAAAVLKYKRHLGIINPAYQKVEDNIVGKMTIKSLDDMMWVLEGGDGLERLERFTPNHPQSPPAPPSLRGALGIPGVAPRSSFAVGGGDDAFDSPVSDMPADLQDAIRRSNAAKTPGQLILYPVLAGHEGPQSLKELSKRFAAEPATCERLLAIHTRMKPFGIWAHINIIFNTYQGVGSKGFFCEPFNHDVLLKLMIGLTNGKQNLVGVRDSPFCRDKFNVHGPRDSFREIVKQGEGLHICVTQPPNRATDHCDFHIDEIQQGQVCFDGFCVPLVNRQTAEHVRKVGPWLAQEAKDKTVDWAKKHSPFSF